MALPVSLVFGSTAAARRVTSAAVANGAPTLPTAGVYAGRRFVNVWAQCDGATSFGVGVWQYSGTSGKWSLRTDIGTAGYTTVTPAANFEAMIDTAVAERIYLEIVNVVGPPTACNTWAEGYGPTD